MYALGPMTWFRQQLPVIQLVHPVFVLADLVVSEPIINTILTLCSLILASHSGIFSLFMNVFLTMTMTTMQKIHHLDSEVDLEQNFDHGSKGLHINSS